MVAVIREYQDLSISIVTVMMPSHQTHIWMYIRIENHKYILKSSNSNQTAQGLFLKHTYFTFLISLPNSGKQVSHNL
jgi:hypothetical protein